MFLKFLIKIQLTKSNPRIIREVNLPCLMPIRVNPHAEISDKEFTSIKLMHTKISKVHAKPMHNNYDKSLSNPIQIGMLIVDV